MSDQALSVYMFGDFRVDARKRVLARKDGEALSLTPKQFDVLLHLVQHAGQVLEKDQLMAALWPGTVVEENNLSQAISGLRKLLGDDGAEHRYIVTAPRRGYRFVADVQPVAAAAPAQETPPPAVPAATGPAPATGTMPATLPPFAAAPAVAPPRPTPKWWPAAVGAAALVVLLLVVPLVWQRWVPASSAGAARSIAVLPFANLSGAREDDFFGEGLSEDMVTQLAQVSGFRVTSRTSTARYKNSTKSLHDIARELGVDYLLTGSVRRADQRFRITAQLVDARRDDNLWARTYERGDQDILAVQGEVATEIATALKGSLLPAEAQQLAKRSKGNPEAFVLYMKGLYVLRHQVVLNRDQFEEAPPLFRKVIELEPSSPLGYVGMANYHYNRARQGLFDPHENIRQADAYLAKALAVDDKSVEAYVQLARVRGLGQWRWAEAEAAAKRAIELDPNNAQAWDMYRLAFLEPQGRLDEALVAQRRAVALDPFSPYMAWRLALLIALRGDCEEAMRMTRANIARDPAYTVNHTLIVNCLESQGKYAEALAENRLTKGYWVTDALLDAQAKALAERGREGYYEVRLKHQVELAQRRPDSWYFAAVVAVQLGRRDEAFRYLDLAMDWVDRNVVYLKVQPDFVKIRDDPRYQAALKRLNLR